MRRVFPAFTLLVTDVAIFYLALWGVLFVNSPMTVNSDLVHHLAPFTIILVIWLLVFYIAELYDFRHFKNFIELAKIFSVALLVAIIIAIIFFYLTASYYGISPKTNLIVFVFTFGFFSLLTRFFVGRNLKKYKTKILFIQPEGDIKNLVNYLSQNSQLGYEPTIIRNMNELQAKLDVIETSRLISIVLPTRLFLNEEITKTVYANLGENINVLTAEDVYEAVFQKIPTSELSEAWLLQNIARPKTYTKIKYFFEPVFAILLIIILLPIFVLISLVVKTTSRGPLIYTQKRVGRSGKIFTLYKFRTMIKDAEREGPRWAETKDPRVTPIGQILRSSHLDEIPQLINIAKNELSFVGPRPERPEFVDKLKKVIPFYDIRHITKPGLAGWAQLNYKYGASVEDAKHKLEYDLFYIKNNSFVLDLVVLLKTIKRVFANAKQN